MAASPKRAPCSCKCWPMCAGVTVMVPASSQVPARGSALFGAVAAGREGGGFGAIADAAKALRPPAGSTYAPAPKATATYGEVYRILEGPT